MNDNAVEKHLEDVATWLPRSVVTHIERDHGGVADWDAPWQHHRKIHWRDTSDAQSQIQAKESE